jgi:tRNA A64-2'-O-ribosylphosphate transferase
MGEWGFSLRRLNTQVLEVVGRMGGIVIVDSTRRGKSMPDALSKTVPIWCAVLNRVLFPDNKREGVHELHTPPQAVSASEHAQIETRIHGFVQKFLETCSPNLAHLRTQITKPLRPIWVTQTSTLPTSPPNFTDFHPVVLCTASRRVRGAEGSEGGYIQGAADDQEAWAHGLTPELFWAHKDKLTRTNEEDLPSLIAELVQEEKERAPDAVPLLVQPTANLYVSRMRNVDLENFDVVVTCGGEPLGTSVAAHVKGKKYLHLRCQSGKLGSRDLRTQLAYLPVFFSSLPEPLGNILVCCETGKDLSVGVALAILCLYGDEKVGESEKGVTVANQRTAKKIDKSFIKQRTAWLTTTSPILNPPRGTLQSVNAFLMPNGRPTTPPVIPPDQSRLRLVTPTSVQPPPNQEQHTNTKTDMNIPAAIFASLQTSPTNQWRFSRTLTSKLASHPSGTVMGTATFAPTSMSSTDTDMDTNPPSLIYSEEGEFTTTTGAKFGVRRSYVYKLENKKGNNKNDEIDNNDDRNEDEKDKGGPAIAVYFHEPNSTSSPPGIIGDLFVEIGPVSSHIDTAAADAETATQTSSSNSNISLQNQILQAQNKTHHLCGEDVYTASWEFSRRMAEGHDEEKWWSVRYQVRGPKKDYVSETQYVREKTRRNGTEAE